MVPVSTVSDSSLSSDSSPVLWSLGSGCVRSQAVTEITRIRKIINLFIRSSIINYIAYFVISQLYWDYNVCNY